MYDSPPQREPAARRHALGLAALAAIGARRAPWLLGVGVMAHGLLWDSWHIGRAPFMPDWYSLACLIVDVGWGLWALGRVSAWRADAG